ncbi:MAG: glycosyltransferase [Thermoleophilia bacterium]
MKISMLGTRGIPGRYSGFETAVEAISIRLVRMGHDVTVYCRPHMIDYDGDSFEGVRLVRLPTVRNKFLDTFVHTFLSTLHMGFRNRSDIGLFFIAGNSPFALMSRVLGIPSLINVDGLDSHRQKWNRLAKTYIRFAEWFSPIASTRTISDSRVIKEYYLTRFGQDTDFIPYGAEVIHSAGTEALERFGLEPGKYVLFVGRLVPENCAHMLIEAFEGIDTEMKLVIVGDASYSEDYIRSLHATRDTRVIFTGYQFGDAFRELSFHSYVFAIPTEVGGTHPVILDAMAAGTCVLVNDHPPNLESIGDAGVSFSGKVGVRDLRDKLAELIESPGLVKEMGQKAKQRVSKEYSWDAVATRYEELCIRYRKHQKTGPGE